MADRWIPVLIHVRGDSPLEDRVEELLDRARESLAGRTWATKHGAIAAGRAALRSAWQALRSEAVRDPTGPAGAWRGAPPAVACEEAARG